MRRLKQLVIMEGKCVGYFENGDKEEELFLISFPELRPDGSPKGEFRVWSPEKGDWLAFKAFQKTGPN